MSGMEEVVAKEALKYSNGIINALLSPKIEKISKWAFEKDLEGKLEPEKISGVMEEYITKLSYRVSEITSLAFPMNKLNIFEAYEPLTLSRQKSFFMEEIDEVSLDEIITEKIKSTLIIDHAGMGKSTFSKYIVASLLFKSDRVPIFFELRKLNGSFDLIESLAKELDFPGRAFDRALFYKLLQLGKFYVIIDGFDEVGLESQEELSKQIHDLSVKGGDNIILLTSRPQELLPDVVKSEILKFRPFSIEQATSLLKRYDELSSLDIGCELISQIDRIPNKFIESPLLVSLLYKTFGVNKSIAEKTCTFYEEIYQALYKGHDLINKNGYGREKKSGLDFEDFRKLLRALCHYMMLKKKTSFESWSEAIDFVEKAIKISSINPVSKSSFIDDLLVSVPLIHKDGTEMKFFHKTFIEYFAAEFVIFHQSSYELFNKMYKSEISSGFQKVFEFIHEMNSSLFDSVITKSLADSAKEMDLSGGVLKRGLYSLILNRECMFGIWQKSEYSLEAPDNEGEISITFDSSKTGLVDEGYHTYGYANGILEDESYFIAFTLGDKVVNYNACAWKSITERIETVSHCPDTATAEDLKVLLSLLETNTWTCLDSNLIEKMESCSSLLKIVLRLVSISTTGFGLVDDDEFRVLSKENVEEVIERVNREKQFSSELEQFL